MCTSVGAKRSRAPLHALEVSLLCKAGPRKQVE